MRTQFMIDGDSGEGMAFVLQTEGEQALGKGGSGKGYDGISPCIAVEIDLNPPQGVSAIRLTEMTPDSVLIEGPDLGFLGDLKIRTLLVDYIVETKTILVQVDGEPMLYGTIDLEQKLGSPMATWGFTAAGSFEHSSDQWIYFQALENESPPPPLPVVAPSPPSPPMSPSVYFYEDFDRHPTQFIFHANMFGEMADPALIVGEASPTKFGKWYNEQSTGGLRLTCTASTQAENLSGGWFFHIDLPEAVETATLVFYYQATLQEGFSPMDNARVFAKVDGTVHVVDTIQGGNTIVQSPWEKATVELGYLSQGTHRIDIGGILSVQDGMADGKSLQIRFDALIVAGVATVE